MSRLSPFCGLALVLTLLVATFDQPVAHAEAEPLIEESDSRKSYWTLALLGGAAIPLSNYANDRDLGLTAQATVAFTGKTGFGAAVLAGYSPLPAIVSDNEIRRDNHVFHAAFTPRFTLGRGTLRLVLGGGGGLVYERTRSESTVDDGPSSNTVSQTAATAIGEAELVLHVFETGGLVLGGSYLRGFGKSDANLANAHAGFLLAF